MNDTDLDRRLRDGLHAVARAAGNPPRYDALIARSEPEPMRRSPWPAVLGAVTVLALVVSGLAALAARDRSDEAAGDADAALWTTWYVTGVTVDGTPLDLSPNLTEYQSWHVAIDGRCENVMSASPDCVDGPWVGGWDGGCNDFSRAVDLADGRGIWRGSALSTLVGCDDTPVSEAFARVISAFEDPSPFDYTVSGDTLTVSANGVVLAFTNVDRFPDPTPAPISAPSSTAPVPTTAPPAPTSVADSTVPDMTTSPGPPLPTGPIPYLAIGDSVMLGAAAELTSRGFVVDASITRQMIDMVPVMQQLAERDVFADVVVVHIGTNGPFDAETLDAFLAPLADVPNVILLNVAADRSWTDPNNALIAARDSDDDNITVIDWHQRSIECGEQCFAGDGIHLDQGGQEFYAELIASVAGIEIDSMVCGFGFRGSRGVELEVDDVTFWLIGGYTRKPSGDGASPQSAAFCRYRPDAPPENPVELVEVGDCGLEPPVVVRKLEYDPSAVEFVCGNGTRGSLDVTSLTVQIPLV